MQNDLLKEVLKNYHIPISARIWRGRRAPAWIMELSHFADLLSLRRRSDNEKAEIIACLLVFKSSTIDGASLQGTGAAFAHQGRITARSG